MITIIVTRDGAEVAACATWEAAVAAVRLLGGTWRGQARVYETEARWSHLACSVCFP